MSSYLIIILCCTTILSSNTVNCDTQTQADSTAFRKFKRLQHLFDDTTTSNSIFRQKQEQEKHVHHRRLFSSASATVTAAAAANADAADAADAGHVDEEGHSDGHRGDGGDADVADVVLLLPMTLLQLYVQYGETTRAIAVPADISLKQLTSFIESEFSDDIQIDLFHYSLSLAGQELDVEMDEDTSIADLGLGAESVLRLDWNDRDERARERGQSYSYSQRKHDKCLAYVRHKSGMPLEDWNKVELCRSTVEDAALNDPTLIKCLDLLLYNKHSDLRVDSVPGIVLKDRTARRFNMHENPMIGAVYRGSVSTVRALIGLGWNVNAVYEYGHYSMLMVVARRQSTSAEDARTKVAMLKLLLDSGASVLVPHEFDNSGFLTVGQWYGNELHGKDLSPALLRRLRGG